MVVNAALMALRRKRARPETSLDESPHGSLDDCPAWVVDFRPNRAQACAAMEAKQAIEKHVSFQRECIPHFASAYWRVFPRKRREKYLGFRLDDVFHMIATGTDPIGGGAETTASDASSRNSRYRMGEDSSSCL